MSVLDNLDPQNFLIECHRENLIHWPGSTPRVADQMARRLVVSFSGKTEPKSYMHQYRQGLHWLLSQLGRLEDEEKEDQARKR